MQLLEVTIQTAVGLHARPAANLVQTAKAFQSDITAKKGGRKVNAKSRLPVLSLGVKSGERVANQAEGSDETTALNATSQPPANDCGEAKGVTAT